MAKLDQTNIKMINYGGSSFEERTTKLLEDNQKELFEIKKDIKKIKRYILVGKIMNFIYLILIIAPIILAIIFLPKIIQNFTQNYLNQINPGSANFDINDLLKSYKDIIK